MELHDILYEKKDGIAIATFNRPAVLNAFRQATLREFISILDDVKERVEKEHVRRTLEATGGHKARAAEILGVSRPRLNRLLEKYGLDERT